MHNQQMAQYLTDELDLDYEEKRQKALRLIYELRFTFGMDRLAREFLREYIDHHLPAAELYPARRAGDERVTGLTLRRV